METVKLNEKFSSIIELKNHFSDIVLKIHDYIDESKKNETIPQELIELYERAKRVIGVLILNYGKISDTDFERVTAVSKYCDGLINLGVLPSKESIQNFYDLVDTLEDDFIIKRFLFLDKTPKQIS